MEGLEKIFENAIQVHDAVNAPRPEDYTGEDGLIYCGVCHQPRQVRLSVLGRERVVGCACKCRQEEYILKEKALKEGNRLCIVQSLKSMSLLTGTLASASFENYETDRSNCEILKIAQKYVDNFDQMYERCQGLLLYGDVGNGKSYTAACIANALLNRGISVVMTSFASILNDWSAASDDGLIGRFNSVRLLILDDLGIERDTGYALEKIFAVIDGRVRSGRPLIVTTNLSPQIMRASDVDIKYRRIYDRILEVCYPVRFEGKSFRSADTVRRYDEMNSFLR